MGGLIKSGDVVRNKHQPHLLYRSLADNTRNFGYVSTSGYLGYGAVSNPTHWEKVSSLDWWKSALRWYLRNLMWFLSFKVNDGLGLIGRELPYHDNDKHYRSATYPINRAKLMFGLLPKEYL